MARGGRHVYRQVKQLSGEHPGDQSAHLFEAWSRCSSSTGLFQVFLPAEMSCRRTITGWNTSYHTVVWLIAGWTTNNNKKETPGFKSIVNIYSKCGSMLNKTPQLLHQSMAAVGYLPWYCEGTREGRPLRACLILLASFHSIAGGANTDRISSQLRVIFSSVNTSQYLPQSGIPGLSQANVWICQHRNNKEAGCVSLNWFILVSYVKRSPGSYSEYFCREKTPLCYHYSLWM